MVIVSTQNALAKSAAKLEKHINLLKYTIFCLSIVIWVSAFRLFIRVFFVRVQFICVRRAGIIRYAIVRSNGLETRPFAPVRLVTTIGRTKSVAATVIAKADHSSFCENTKELSLLGKKLDFKKLFY